MTTVMILQRPLTANFYLVIIVLKRLQVAPQEAAHIRVTAEKTPDVLSTQVCQS